MKLLKFIPITYISFIFLFAKGTGLETHLVSPQAVQSGIIATDNLRSELYLIKDNEIKTILAERGCGYYSLSPDKEKIGIKIINDRGMERPALFDINNNEISYLCDAVKNAGQVSFTNEGTYAYTLGNDLHLSTGQVYDLGNYANLAPISPEGNFVAYNDDNDQIFLLNLATGRKTMLTDTSYGYYNPQWSPGGDKLLISRFDAQMCIYDKEKEVFSVIGAGHSPSWQDNETIVFYRKEIDGMELINTDIYSIKSDGSSLIQLTNTTDQLEIDPCFDRISETLIYNSMESNTLKSISLGSSLKKQSANTIMQVADITPTYASISAEKSSTESALNVPYIHQVYDVPNWFWGYYACGPTTAAMLLAYYNILPKWPCSCSSPTSHKSNWGRYICEKYYYNGWYYDDGSQPKTYDTGYGGYGYMWGNGSPSSMMANYYKKHGLTTSQTFSAQGKWSKAVSEIENGYPYTLCVWLTSSGHLVLGKGIVDGKHSVIVNDPYGNRNTAGYPSYDGGGAVYDWPGYNHGNVNLAYAGTGVPWVIAAHYESPTVSDTLIDDLNLTQGFELNATSPATMKSYKDKKAGYNNHFWYMQSETSSITEYAEWTPTIDKDGNYELLLYIPDYTDKCQKAIYQVYNGEEWKNYSLNQTLYNDQWASLGIFSLKDESTIKVRLIDSTDTEGSNIVIDAFKYLYAGEWELDFSADQVKKSVPMTVAFTTTIDYNSNSSSYQWDFGDGYSSYEKNPSHTYKTSGNYDVKLIFRIGLEEYTIEKNDYIEALETSSGDFSLALPKKDTIITTQTPTFSWEEQTGYSYRFYIDSTSNFSTTIPVELEQNQYTINNSLKDNFEYFWMVKAISPTDTMSSDIYYFTINTKDDGPSQFELTYPRGEEVVTSCNFAFQWDRSTDYDKYDVVNYVLNLCKDSGDTNQIYSGTDNFYTDSLEDNSTYQWFVMATDNQGHEVCSNTTLFYVNVSNDAPAPVTLLTPESGCTISDKYPEFSWTESSDIDPLDSVYYELFIFKEGYESRGVTVDLDTTYFNEQKISTTGKYGFTVACIDQNEGVAYSDTSFFYFGSTAIEDENGIPVSFELHQNYPNPFNPATSIKFDIPQTALVTLSIYDISGRLVKTLVNESLDAGYHTRIWQPKNVSSGVYFYRIEAVNGDFHQSQIQKCLFIK